MFNGHKRRPHGMDEVEASPELPCHICGGQSYSWGSLAAQGINFTPEDAF